MATEVVDVQSALKRPLITEVLPRQGLVYSEKSGLTEVLCKPKIMPIKSSSLMKLEALRREASEGPGPLQPKQQQQQQQQNPPGLASLQGQPLAPQQGVRPSTATNRTAGQSAQMSQSPNQTQPAPMSPEATQFTALF